MADKPSKTLLSKVISVVNNLGTGGASGAKKRLANRHDQLAAQEAKAMGNQPKKSK